MKKNTLLWLMPIICMVLIAPFTPYLDLTLSRYFYPFTSNAFYDFIYHYGVLPSWLVVIPALIIVGLSYFIKIARTPALYLVLTLAIGSGIITHAILKDHWGRPRPRQVIEFGGTENFRPFYKPNLFGGVPGTHSFPCGHCSVGFYFFSLVVLGSRLKKKWLTYLGWFVALTLGILLGIARIAQGGHFLSDVLVASLVMWLTALFCDWLLFEELQ